MTAASFQVGLSITIPYLISIVHAYKRYFNIVFINIILVLLVNQMTG